MKKGVEISLGDLYASRRSFLKAGGLAAAGVALNVDPQTAPAEGAARAAQGHAAGEPASGASSVGLVGLVNVLQGTASNPQFSVGNTLPIAALPFGMAHWTVQSNDDTPWMFQPERRRFQGFRCTHQLSPWLSDYGQATFLPYRGKAVGRGAGDRASSYRPGDLALSPHSLKLFLLRYRAQVELVPTERCCVMSAAFDTQDEDQTQVERGWIFDVPGGTGAVEPDPATRRIRFTSTANAGGVPANFATYYVLEFSEPWQTYDLKVENGHRLGMLSFSGAAPLQLKVATSFISFEQAERNLAQEIGAKSIDELRNAAAARWNDHLGRIEVEGATDDQQRVLYSCMYRALLFPRMWHEPTAGEGQHHFSAFNGKVEPGVMYADHGYWDVYRAWYPMMAILFPERLGEILQAWVNAYKEGGWLPQFPAPGYRACMTGSLIDAVFADAVVKGIQGFDVATAYEGLKKHATTPGDPDKGYGRVGIEQYLKLHYVPADQIEQSVAETVDAAFGDFCIAQVAKSLGKHEDAAMFMKRSENWRNVFDPSVEFFRGKNTDGTWLSPFDAFTWGSPYVEGSAWQHRWDAPQNVPGLIAALGGKAAAAQALATMVTLPTVFHVGVYGVEIHEMSEMAAVPFGQYAQSNQPVHHVLYIGPHTGAAQVTQKWARRVMAELYTPDTFPGDEDTGSMAAWFLMSALGFYPLTPGTPEYTFGSPLFKKATLHLPGGKIFIVEAPGNTADTVFVKRLTLNGKTVQGTVLSHADVVQGGTLRFEMSEQA
jgi:predicted alpha-1,2-mannosidase